MFEQPGICLLSDKMRLLAKIGNMWKTESKLKKIKTKCKSLFQLHFSVELEEEEKLRPKYFSPEESTFWAPGISCNHEL